MAVTVKVVGLKTVPAVTVNGADELPVPMDTVDGETVRGAFFGTAIEMLQLPEGTGPLR